MKQEVNGVLFIGTGQVSRFIQELCPSMEEVKRGIRLSDEVMVEALTIKNIKALFHFS